MAINVLSSTEFERCSYPWTEGLERPDDLLQARLPSISYGDNNSVQIQLSLPDLNLCQFSRASGRIVKRQNGLVAAAFFLHCQF
jgi:hypothetical protein